MSNDRLGNRVSGSCEASWINDSLNRAIAPCQFAARRAPVARGAPNAVAGFLGGPSSLDSTTAWPATAPPIPT